MRLVSTSIVFILLFTLSCGRQGLLDVLDNVSIDEYRGHDLGTKFILPDSTEAISLDALLEFDCNVYFLWAKVTADIGEVEEILGASIPSEAVDADRFSQAKLRSPFDLATFHLKPESVPVWWKDDSRFTLREYAAWEKGGYGYGCLILYDPNSQTLLGLRWSQQHLRTSKVHSALAVEGGSE